MKASCFLVVIAVAAICLTATPGASGTPTSTKDADVLLELHQELINAHLDKDVDKLLAPEPDKVVRVGRGEVVFEAKAERIPRFKDYLENTEFEIYEDLIDPIVRVSEDGTLGWVIAQVRVAGTRTYDAGESKKFDTVWAWIELWEKRDGRWYRIGDVSNVKPE